MSVTPDMNWKPTALFSGAGLLVTWLANLPPGAAPATPIRAPQVVSTPAAADIQQQADRLRARVRQEVAFGNPARDPFRFAPHRVEPAATPAPVTAVQAPAAITIAPPRLSGVAIDVVDGREERTAILNTPSGLMFSHEGDQVAGRFQVKSISEDAVVLIRLDDGSEVRLR